MKFSALSNLQQRLIMGGLAIILALIVTFFSYANILSGFIFTFFVALVVSAALMEYYQCAQAKGFQPLVKIGIIGTLTYFCALYASHLFPKTYMLPSIVIGFTAIAAFLYYFIKGVEPFVNLAITFFGIVYLTIPLGCLILINFFPDRSFFVDGRWCLVYLLLVTKITDMGAFFVGKLYGKRKMSPYISPKKTWEGAVGGLLSALFISFIFYIIFSYFLERPPFELSFVQSIWLAILLSVVAQFGDLAESLLKRDAGIKDSGTHLPGLGGFLDIVDSLVFTSPLMYLFLNLTMAPQP